MVDPVHGEVFSVNFVENDIPSRPYFLIDAADGIMVARGDLGVEVPLEVLPRIQRRIIRTCAEMGKRAIVATHMLESMIENPIPTRAEVTDVANAVYEEADAIMLSGETTVGKYPVKCVEILDRIARSTESSRGLRFTDNLNVTHDKQHIANYITQMGLIWLPIWKFFCLTS